MKIITKADIALIIVVFILSIVSIFTIPKLLVADGNGKEIVVYLDGNIIHRFPLIESPESEFIEFSFEINDSNYTGRLEMKDGYVRLHRLSDEISPLSIHADMGWIREPYQMIVSLPIKMYITVEDAEEEESLIDIIVQ
ncbi:hypothetical protein SAMN05446037_1011112 [Anaerovirgula multivorans]|uniref:Uncharacterized protein n=1 Tax=Anaerovirgula multivorans TaxID=312168 RepID=A0A239F0D7_9FIRM|nr:NusG domain II-containing protein [Anaerovirgula multivorans]SNS49998.1 hypothetical protein SAMN05446037_1011112 [Anaerovirgula multivorans]